MLEFIKDTWFIITTKPILFLLISGIAFGFGLKLLKWSFIAKEIQENMFKKLMKVIEIFGFVMFLFTLILPIYLHPFGYGLTFFYLWVSFFPSTVVGRLIGDPISIFHIGKKYHLTLFAISTILFLCFFITFLIFFIK